MSRKYGLPVRCGSTDFAASKLDAERLSGLEVDDQFELGRLYNRQIGGLLAFENPSRVNADLPKRAGEIGSVAHEPAVGGIGAAIVDRRNLVTRRERDDLIAPA